MGKVLGVIVLVLAASCTFIAAGKVKVVKVEPTNCEFLSNLGQAFANSWEEGISDLQSSTVQTGGNTLYLPDGKQTVMANIVGPKYLSVGYAYLCPEK